MPKKPQNVSNGGSGLLPIAIDSPVRKKRKIPSLRQPWSPCWLMIILLMMISYVTSTSSDSDCLSRLSDDLSKDLNAERARIFVISDKNHEMSWTWQIEDGGLSSSLRSPLMTDLSPQFSNDGGLTWTTALEDACQVNDKLTVNFSRIDPEMSEDPAKTEKVRKTMQNGIRNSGPGILSWTLKPSEIGLEQSGTWLV